MRNLPVFVSRLLDELGQGQLAGDLTEERHAGRSLVWVWWQACAAVVAGLSSTVRRRPYLTVRAVAIGWTTLILVGASVLGLLRVLPRPAWVMPVLPFVWQVFTYLACGWVVARLHRQHRLALVLVTMLSMAFANAIVTSYGLWHNYYNLTHPHPSDYLLHMSRMRMLSSAMVPLLLPLFVAVGGRYSRHRDPVT